MSTSYRARPVLVLALCWDGTDERLRVLKKAWAPAFARHEVKDEDGATHGTKTLLVPTPEGVLPAQVGDWVVRDPQGSVRPVRADLFRQLYEAAP